MIKCLKLQGQNDGSIDQSYPIFKIFFSVLSLMMDLSFNQNEFDQSDLRPSSRPLILIGQTITKKQRKPSEYSFLPSFPRPRPLCRLSAKNTLIQGTVLSNCTEIVSTVKIDGIRRRHHFEDNENIKLTISW